MLIQGNPDLESEEIIIYPDVSSIVQDVLARTWGLVENGTEEDTTLVLGFIAQSFEENIDFYVLSSVAREEFLRDVVSPTVVAKHFGGESEHIVPVTTTLDPLLERITLDEQHDLRDEIISTAADQTMALIMKNKLEEAIRLRETYIAWGFITPEDLEVLPIRSSRILGNYLKRLIRDRDVATLDRIKLDLTSENIGTLLGSRGINLLRSNVYVTVDNAVTQSFYDNSFIEVRAVVDSCLEKGLITLRAYESLLEKLPNTHRERALISIMNYIVNASGFEAKLLPIQIRLNNLYTFITENPNSSEEEILEYTLSLLTPNISFKGKSFYTKNLDIMDIFKPGLTEEQANALDASTKRYFIRLITELAVRGKIEEVQLLALFFVKSERHKD